MKKVAAIAVLGTVLLTGVAVASAAPQAPIPQVMNQYDLTNQIITDNWNSLTNGKRTDYLKHPEKAPTNLFPYGIELNVGPKGAPACFPSKRAATYAPTLPLDC